METTTEEQFEPEARQYSQSLFLDHESSGVSLEGRVQILSPDVTAADPEAINNQLNSSVLLESGYSDPVQIKIEVDDTSNLSGDSVCASKPGDFHNDTTIPCHSGSGSGSRSLIEDECLDVQPSADSSYEPFVFGNNRHVAMDGSSYSLPSPSASINACVPASDLDVHFPEFSPVLRNARAGESSLDTGTDRALGTHQSTSTPKRYLFEQGDFSVPYPRLHSEAKGIVSAAADNAPKPEESEDESQQTFNHPSSKGGLIQSDSQDGEENLATPSQSGSPSPTSKQSSSITEDTILRSEVPAAATAPCACPSPNLNDVLDKLDLQEINIKYALSQLELRIDDSIQATDSNGEMVLTKIHEVQERLKDLSEDVEDLQTAQSSHEFATLDDWRVVTSAIRAVREEISTVRTELRGKRLAPEVEATMANLRTMILSVQSTLNAHILRQAGQVNAPPSPSVTVSYKIDQAEEQRLISLICDRVEALVQKNLETHCRNWKLASEELFKQHTQSVPADSGSGNVLLSSGSQDCDSGSSVSAADTGDTASEVMEVGRSRRVIRKSSRMSQQMFNQIVRVVVAQEDGSPSDSKSNPRQGEHAKSLPLPQDKPTSSKKVASTSVKNDSEKALSREVKTRRVKRKRVSTSTPKNQVGAAVASSSYGSQCKRRPKQSSDLQAGVKPATFQSKALRMMAVKESRSFGLKMINDVGGPAVRTYACAFALGPLDSDSHISVCSFSTDYFGNLRRHRNLVTNHSTIKNDGIRVNYTLQVTGGRGSKQCCKTKIDGTRCDYQKADSSIYWRHYRQATHREDVVLQNFHCRPCGTKFDTDEYFWEHLNISTRCRLPRNEEPLPEPSTLSGESSFQLSRPVNDLESSASIAPMEAEPKANVRRVSTRQRRRRSELSDSQVNGDEIVCGSCGLAFTVYKDLSLHQRFSCIENLE